MFCWWERFPFKIDVDIWSSSSALLEDFTLLLWKVRLNFGVDDKSWAVPILKRFICLFWQSGQDANFSYKIVAICLPTGEVQVYVGEMKIVPKINFKVTFFREKEKKSLLWESQDLKRHVWQIDMSQRVTCLWKQVQLARLIMIRFKVYEVFVNS